MSIQPTQKRDEQALVLYREPSLIPVIEEFGDNFEIPTRADFQAIYFAQDNGIKVKYLSEFRAISPIKGGEFSEEIRFKLMGPIAREIGNLIPIEGEASSLWRNSARTVDGLVTHSKEAAPVLKEIACAAAKEGDGVADFGPKEKYITKDPVSLAQKVQRKSSKGDGGSVELAVRKIGDAVRGTVFFPSPQKMRMAIQKFQDLLARKGMKVVFDNKWIVSRKDGYTGIHAKLLLKTPKGANVIGELQFHLKDLYDGSAGMVKQRAHKIYEQIRSSDKPQKEAEAASNFMYAAAIGRAAATGTCGKEALAVAHGRVQDLIEPAK